MLGLCLELAQVFQMDRRLEYIFLDVDRPIKSWKLLNCPVAFADIRKGDESFGCLQMPSFPLVSKMQQLTLQIPCEILDCEGICLGSENGKHSNWVMVP